MDLGIRVDPAPEPLPRITFHWDVETEILAGRFAPEEQVRGFTGTIEYQAHDGAVVTVDVDRGVLCGLEIVVWPQGDQRDGLAPPAADPGRVTMPARPSQPGIGAVEVDTPISLRTTPKEDVMHLRMGTARVRRAVRIADQLIVELSEDGDLAGFWLSGVPPFPAEER